jgi:adenylate cyclase
LSLFKELKRRNVFKVAIAYIVMAWLVMQVADVVLNNITAPGWIFHVLMLFLAIGLPFAVFFAWAFELTSEGLKREHEVDRTQSITHVTGRKLDRAVVAVLIIALAYFAYDKFVLSAARDAARVEAMTQAVTEQATVEPKAAAEPDKSIAVLPFVNMSDDAGNEYFSDGLSEELLNLLAKIPELRVTSRSSAFSFKGQNLDVPTMAARLKVDYVLEGSVRKFGNQLRITAQLIEVVTDTHLWSETYNRELENIFVIQDEIAAAVVNALKITLLGEAPKATETDPETFALYLQARHLRDQNTFASLQQAESLLNQALVIDPRFAPAWTALAYVYLEQGWSFDHRSYGEGTELARQAIQTALEIDPHDGRSYDVLALVAGFYDWEFEMAFQYLQEALKLNPSDADILLNAGELNTNLGRFKEANDLLQRSIALDPVSAVSHYRLGQLYYITHRLDEAAATLHMALSLNPGGSRRHQAIGFVLLAQGDAQAALVAMQQETSDVFRLYGIAVVQHALGNIGASDAALQELIEEHATGMAVQVASVYAFRNEINSAFDWLEQAYENRDSGLALILFNPMLANLYGDPRWNLFLDKMGLPH